MISSLEGMCEESRSLSPFSSVVIVFSPCIFPLPPPSPLPSFYTLKMVEFDSGSITKIAFFCGWLIAVGGSFGPMLTHRVRNTATVVATNEVSHTVSAFGVHTYSYVEIDGKLDVKDDDHCTDCSSDSIAILSIVLPIAIALTGVAFVWKPYTYGIFMLFAISCSVLLGVFSGELSLEYEDVGADNDFSTSCRGQLCKTLYEGVTLGVGGVFIVIGLLIQSIVISHAIDQFIRKT